MPSKNNWTSIKIQSTDQSSMIFGRRTYKSNRTFKPHRGLYSHPLFQRKYVYYLVMTMTGLALFFYAPAIYFLTQNYDLITQLAYDTHPSLVQNLEREVHWLWVFSGTKSSLAGMD